MPRRPLPRRIEVKLSESEYAQLAERAATLGLSRSALVRSSLRMTAGRDPAAGDGRLCRRDVLALLALRAEDGSVPAAIALARELRVGPLEQPAPAVPVLSAEERRRGDELAALRALHERVEREVGRR
jgi:hypothetical protein